MFFCANAVNCPHSLGLPTDTDLDELRLDFEEVVRDNTGDDPAREADWLRRMLGEWHAGPDPLPAECLRQRVFALWVNRALGARSRRPVPVAV